MNVLLTPKSNALHCHCTRIPSYNRINDYGNSLDILTRFGSKMDLSYPAYLLDSTVFTGTPHYDTIWRLKNFFIDYF